MRLAKGSHHQQVSDMEAAAESVESRLSQAYDKSKLDPYGLQRLLKDRISPSDQHVIGDVKEPVPAVPAQARSKIAGKTIKVLLGVAIVAVFGVSPVRTLLETSSVEAVVNARVVTLRSPIQGQVLASGNELSAPGVQKRGTPLLRVVDVRADSEHLDDLKQRLDRLSAQRAAIAARRTSAQAARVDLHRKAEQFRLARIEQIDARVAQLNSLAVAAASHADEATAQRDRATLLVRSGTVSRVALAHYVSEAAVATQNQIAVLAQIKAAGVERDSAVMGVYLGDGYNDLPSSVLRIDDLRREIVDLDGDLATDDTEIAQLAGQVATETARHAALADATLSLPVDGRIWETLVSPGEQVRIGQDLVKVLDCSAALVTANVTESVYNRLSVGAPARFIPADGGPALSGRVVQLTGVAGARANLAIEPAALVKEPYRVAVSVSDLDTRNGCAVGRTGRVVFGQADSTER